MGSPAVGLVLRRAFEAVALSIAGFRLVETVYAGGSPARLPLELSGRLRAWFNAGTPPEGLRRLVKVRFDGVGLAFEGGRSWGLDAAHTYFPLSGGGRVELLLLPRRFLWKPVPRLEYIALVDVDWELFTAGLELLAVYDYLSGLGRRDLASLLLEDLAHGWPEVEPHQWAAAGLLLLDSHWDRGSPYPRKDLPGGRMEAEFYASRLGPRGVAAEYEAKPPYKAEAARRALALVRKALSRLQKARSSEPRGGRLYLVGHSHVDLAWLWPPSEGAVRAAATLSTAAGLAEEAGVPYALHTPQALETASRVAPGLLERARRLVESGLWTPVGGFYVEGDLQVVDGESLARQLLYGQRTYLRLVGRRARLGWLPDNFGYPASLPQLLRKAGLEALVIHKVTWGERGFGLHAFRWRGLDGTEIPVLVVHDAEYAYNAPMRPSHLKRYWESFQARGAAPHVYPYGYGDGGGGPTLEMAAAARISSILPGMPEVVHGGLDRLVEDLARSSWRLPLLEGELYLELHRGAYTTNVSFKRLVSRLEEALRALEIAGSLAEALGLGSYPQWAGESWKRLLEAEFHDLMAGTAVEEAYSEVTGALSGELERAERAIESAMGDGGPAVFNALPWRRAGLVGSGSPLEAPCQRLGRSYLALVEAPGLGARAYRRGGECRARSLEGEAWAEDAGSEVRLGNGLVEAVLDGEGMLVSLRAGGAEVLAEPSGVVAVHHDSPGLWDAWDIDEWALKGREVLSGSRPRVSAWGPLRSCARLAMKAEGVRVEGEVCVDALSPTLDYRLRVHIARRQVLLKAWFKPLVAPGFRALFDVPFGYVERRPEDLAGPKFESPALRWAAFHDGSRGLLIASPWLHGYGYRDGWVSLSLAKRPVYPNPRTDEGGAEAVFHVAPVRGGLDPAWALRVALERWSPLRLVRARLEGEASLARVEPEGRVMVSAFKRGESGGWIVRLFNPVSEPVEAVIEPLFRVSAAEEVTIDETGRLGALEVEGGAVRVPLRGFEVKTVRLLT